MAEVKVKAEVAGRICLLFVEVGALIAAGDEIVVVEAMKMEIPQPSPSAGQVKSILVSIDDVVAEGQVLAIVAS